MAAGVPLDQVGARAQVRGGDGGAGSFRRGCAATRPCSRTDGCAPPRGPPPRPRGRRAAVMRRYPRGAVRGTELGLDEKGQPASCGGSRRLRPAAPAVVARPPGTPPLAHQCDRVAVLLAVNGLVLPSHFCSLAKYAADFLGTRIATPGVAQLGAQPPDLSRLAAETLLILGGGKLPAVPARLTHHSSGPADHKKQ